MSKNETYRYHYRFGLVSENMWNAEQYLASATSKVSDPEDNSWLEIQPDKYHNRPYVLEVMSKGECFGRLGQISKMDNSLKTTVIYKIKEMVTNDKIESISVIKTLENKFKVELI